MNREQRRAQLKQLGKKFSGIDVTKGTLDIPVGNSEKVTLDLMNFDTIYYLSEMSEKRKKNGENMPIVADKNTINAAFCKILKL